MTMNTTPTAPQPTAPHSSRTRTVVVGIVALIVGAGIAAGLVIGLGGAPATAAAAAATPVAAATTSHTGHHVTPPAPPAPTAAIKTLQSELGQLNYYEGPITGTMTPQTVQAIDYLQRDAHLPQTGTMNAATQAALAHFLATGNNQMGS
jgi:peptidoglycan hydrolase-like protein with peptidoglycan-binding domain